MLKKSDIPQIIKIGIILFLITGISALILAAANSVTAPVIAENDRIKQENAMRKVMPEADSENGFEELESAADTEKGIVKVYAAKKEGTVCGYAVISEPVGYGGTITMAVGIDLEGKVTGIDITSQAETPGLGARCVEPEFTGQFAGKTEGIAVVKGSPKENEIDAISSATITSKAVTLGVNNAIDAVKAVKEGE